MFGRMFAIENRKLFKQSIVWIEAALMVGIVIVVQVVMFVASRLEATGSGEQGSKALEQMLEMVTWPGSLVMSLSLAGGAALGSMLAIILTGAVVTQEYQWRTLHLWLGHGVSRGVYALARFAALLLPVLLMVCLALLAGALVSAIFTVQAAGGLPLAQVNWVQLGLSVLRAAYSVLPYVALTFWLGVATRSAVVAIGGGLAFSLLFENVVAQLLVLLGGGAAELVRYLPASMANAVMQLNQAIVAAPTGAPETSTGLPAPDITLAVIGIALYTLVFFALGALSLRKQDLTG